MTSILLLFVYLLATTAARELLKLPIAFIHYQEHKGIKHDITIYEFLNMHYTYDSPMDEDYERDMQLPFKTLANPITMVAPCIVSETSLLEATKLNLIQTQIKISYTSLKYSFDHLSFIWHPPKGCQSLYKTCASS